MASLSPVATTWLPTWCMRARRVSRPVVRPTGQPSTEQWRRPGTRCRWETGALSSIVCCRVHQQWCC